MASRSTHQKHILEKLTMLTRPPSEALKAQTYSAGARETQMSFVTNIVIRVITINRNT